MKKRAASPLRKIRSIVGSAPSSAVVKRSGVYRSNDHQCSEITSTFGRCQNSCTPGTSFCHVHQRKKLEHEDKVFDSTFAHVAHGIWIGSIDTTNDPDALKAAGIKSIVNISGWEPRSKTRAMYKKLGISYQTLTTRDRQTGKLRYLGDEPIGGRLSLGEFYRYMDRGVEMVKNSKAPTLVNCFTEEHQLLTNKGFMFLHEVEQYNGKDLLFASYDPETEELLYEPFTLVVNQKQKHNMIEMTHNNEAWKWDGSIVEDGRKLPSNNMSIVATEGHKMYVKHGLSQIGQKGVYWKSHRVYREDGTRTYVQNPYKKVDAVDLLSDNERDCVKFLGVARGGVRQNSNSGDPLPFIEKLSLQEEQIMLFLELYGYWLGDGSMSFCNANGIGYDALVFMPSKDQDEKWLTERLNELSVEYVYSQYETGSRHRFVVKDPEFVDYFRSQYQHNYECHVTSMYHVTPEEKTQEKNVAKSGKWLWWWVWNLNKEQAQAVLRGLRMADGCEAHDENLIFTSSVRFRDEIVRLALNAGYSAHFHLMYEKGAHRGVINGRPVIANHDNWGVSYNIGVQYAEPNLRAKRDIKRVTYDGRTWCVRVPHGFVVVRRAHFDKAKECITVASRPIIASNCYAGVNRSASLVAAYLMSVYKMPFSHARHYLIEANKKRSIDVLTNRDFVSALSRYPEHLQHVRSRSHSR